MSTKNNSTGSFKKQFSSIKENDAELKSFLHVGQHVRVLKRLENGHKSLTELQNFIKERAIVEEKYANSLRMWSDKYGQILSKGSEYNSTKNSIQDNLNEARQVADLHDEVAQQLRNDIQPKVKEYQKQHYHTKFPSGFKEVGQYEKEFSKPVKRWGKVYGSMVKSREAYYNSCKQEKTAEKQLAGTENDLNTMRQTNGKTDALESKLLKQKNNLKKRTSQVNDNREKYRTAVEECDNERASYKAEMVNIFDKTNIDEKARLEFMKQTLARLYRSLDLSESERFCRIYQDTHDRVQKINVEGDIEWWSNTRGIGMEMDWPIFEEFNEDLAAMKSINYKQSQRADKHIAGGSSIGTLSYRENGFDKDFESNTDLTSPKLNGDVSHRSLHSISEHRLTEDSLAHGDTNNNSMKASKIEEKTISLDIPLAGNDPEIQVEALFEYEAQDEDELSLSVGQKITQIMNEDDHGWCKGRLSSGKEGLYPATYVRVVN